MIRALLLLCACTTSAPQPADPPDMRTTADAPPVEDLHLGMGPTGAGVTTPERPEAPPSAEPTVPEGALVTEGLDPMAVARVLERQRRSFRTCGEDPVTLHMVVDSEGRVVQGRTEPPNPCITDALRRVRMPRPTSRDVEIAWPWVP